MRFDELVQSVVGENADIHSLAEQCCRECGLPEGCACVDDVVDTDKWIRWPIGRFSDILTAAKHSH